MYSHTHTHTHTHTYTHTNTPEIITQISGFLLVHVTCVFHFLIFQDKVRVPMILRRDTHSLPGAVGPVPICLVNEIQVDSVADPT